MTSQARNCHFISNLHLALRLDDLNGMTEQVNEEEQEWNMKEGKKRWSRGLKFKQNSGAAQLLALGRHCIEMMAYWVTYVQRAICVILCVRLGFESWLRGSKVVLL